MTWLVLWTLVLQYSPDFLYQITYTIVLQLFARLSSQISDSRQQVHAAKENLVGCKKMLTCRREELKKLWLESVEYKYTLQLLNEMWVLLKHDLTNGTS